MVPHSRNAPVIGCHDTVLFPTVGFALFFPVVFIVAWLLRPRPEWWKAFLLLASIVFFGWWDWRAAVVLAGLVLVAEVGATAIHRAAEPGHASGVVGRRWWSSTS